MFLSDIFIFAFTGFGIGYLLDKRFEQTPLLSIIFLIVGFVAGLYKIYLKGK